MSESEPLIWCPGCDKYESITLTGEELGKSNETIRYGYCNVCDCEVEVHVDLKNYFKSINIRQ